MQAGPSNDLRRLSRRFYLNLSSRNLQWSKNPQNECWWMKSHSSVQCRRMNKIIHQLKPETIPRQDNLIFNLCLELFSNDWTNFWCKTLQKQSDPIFWCKTVQNLNNKDFFGPNFEKQPIDELFEDFKTRQIATPTPSYSSLPGKQKIKFITGFGSHLKHRSLDLKSRWT